MECGGLAEPGRSRCKIHTETHRRSGTKTYQAKRQLINKARNEPCIDCGIKLPPECMDLDHVHGEKSFAVGAMGSASIEKLLAEIAKCEVRCPNCHRLRHFYSRGKE